MANVPPLRAAALTALAAELLLLLRLALSDDRLGASEVGVVERLAVGVFAVRRKDLDALLSSLLASGQDADLAPLRATFRARGRDRNLVLAGYFFDMVSHDADTAERMGRLSVRVADILALDPDEVAGLARRHCRG